jgi:HEAT repeat protein
VATFVPYRDNRDDFIKACAVAGMSLAGGNGNQLVEQLKAGLASDNVYVRIAVGWALAARRDKNGVAALDAAFKTDDPRQRTTAGDALVDVANRPTAGAE